MKKRYSRALATLAAIGAGALAALALKPSTRGAATAVAARNPAVEVRTQVIRRTIHVIRHEPGAVLRGSVGYSRTVTHTGAPVRSATSGAHHSTSAAAGTTVITRSSGSHAAPSSSGPVAAPVTTRTSGTHGAPSASSPASRPVRTRTSGTHSGSSSGTSRPVTRTSGSGGHGGDGSDGGDGHHSDD